MRQKIFAGSKSPAVFVLIFAAPVFVLFLLFVFPDLAVIGPEKLQTLLVGYCIVLLGFFTGTRYGVLLRGTEAQTAWILPFIFGPVLAIIILLMPFSLALAVLIVVFGGHGAWDSWVAFKGGLPRDYSTRRSFLTILVCFILIAILIVNGFY